MAMDLAGTIKGSMLEGFYPAGWDLKKIDKICARPPEDLPKPEKWWHEDFELVMCDSIADLETMMGHEIAMTIRQTARSGDELVLILPVGPMGMYRWVKFFLEEWNIPCQHVHGFNMDEWSDSTGKTLAPGHPASFQNAMQDAFYGPLGELTVPANQRHFATKAALPKYGAQIEALRKKGAKLAVIFGLGRMCHVAFWEPHFAADYKSEAEWKKQTHRLAAKLHPLTIEQNAITSFKSRTTLVPAYANTIGPGLFLGADKIIGGADGHFDRGMQWQGMTMWMSLHHKPTPWITTSYMPTQPGRIFCAQPLAGPLVADCN